MKKRSAPRDAFSNPRVLFGFVLGFVGVALALIGFGLYPGASLLAGKPDQPQTQQWQPKWEVIHSSHNDVSAPLREMATWDLPPVSEHEAPENPQIGIVRESGSRPDTVVQKTFAESLLADVIPGLNFDGIPYPGVVCFCAPPDTNGEVGATQYVQIVNEAYQVFDKATGNSILGPASINSVWAGFGGVCQAGQGDPVMLYDQIANRWLISQFSGGLTHECIAISTTSDATGTWNRYDFTVGAGALFDYPKIGVWPDGYYMAMNVFNSAGTAYLGTQPFAFDRTKMLAGLPATMLTPGLVGSPANNEDPLMPADFDGSILPPSGAPNTFVEFPDSIGNNLNTYRSWHYSVGVPFGTNPTFTQVPSPPAAPFAFLFASVPQRAPGTSLGNLADRLMFRLAYRNFGTPAAPDESLVANYTVSSGGVAGIRWFELKNPTNGPITVKQESTYQPDTTWRWMGSAAMDQAGNLALGFSASSAAIEPEIRYATRLATDPLNTLTAEAHLFDGTGVQIGTSGRWGDYSSMTVDPVDDCTFWYTQEYYATDSSFNWRTRIGNFKFDSCGGGGDIVLQARVRAQGNKHQVQLLWSPADGGNMNILRNGAVIATVPDSGRAKSNLGTRTGTFIYQVCETDSGDCSNEVEVVVP